VERTVGEVLPALIKSQKDFKEAIESLTKETAKREVELNEYKLKYNIKVKGDSKETSGGEEEKKTRGVLA
jgi:chromosome segregation and condensation protein ScpB